MTRLWAGAFAALLGAAQVGEAAESPLQLGDPEGLSMRPGLLLDARAAATLGEAPTVGIQRARPLVRGTLAGPAVGYWVQLELAQGPAVLLDATISVAPAPWAELTVGRMLVPFSRAQITPLPLAQLHGWAESVGVEAHGRDVGVQLTAKPLAGRLDARFGVYQGPTSDVSMARPALFGRVGFDLIGRVPLDETVVVRDPDGAPGLAIGASGAAGADARRRDGATLDTRAVGVDIAARLGPTRAQAELFARAWADGARELGGYAMASVAVAPKVEIATRLDLTQTDSRAWTGQGLVSWSPRDAHLRVSAEYSHRRVRGAPATHALAIQQQLWF